MVAALSGRRASHKADSRRDLLLAYHTGAFAGVAFAGKLKSFDQYVTEAAPDDGRKLQHANAIAFFSALKAKGFPVEIKRTVN
jgi:hypothetical protein